ncbi:hypothetical protein NVP1164O_58 [Vibrio phage 1.164.O._10N.261.51.A7]|nr:hypothetical protein NVP1164O_58 [Vibrio phage 1.164.O._10N.261.51.A7]
MGFFDQFAHEGKKVDGSEENATVQTSSIVPGGTKAVAMLESVKWDEYEGNRKVKAQWKIAAGTFTGRVVFQNIELFAKKFGTQEADEKKAFRAANVLKRLFMLTGAPIPDVEPTDADFAQMVGKMAGISIELWEMNGKSGNWISEIQPSKGFENVDGTEMPTGNTGGTDTQPELSVDDDW